MANYYVATDGDDADPGTFAEPWLTVEHAMTTAVAGDVVYFRDGTWTLTGALDNFNNGAVGNPIVFQAYSYRGAEWTVSVDTPVVDLLNNAHIWFASLVIRGYSIDTSTTIMNIEDSNNIYIYGCEITGTGGRGIWLRGGAGGHDNTIRACEIHNEGRGESLDGIQSSNDDVTIYQNTIYHTPHVGIGIKDGDNVLIYENEIYDTSSHGISIGNIPASITGCEVYDNVIYRCGNPDWNIYNPFNDKHGIRIHGNATVIAHNNVIYECNGPGLGVRNTSDDARVWNNTLYNNFRGAAPIGDYGDFALHEEVGEPGVPYIEFYNNIIYHTRAGGSTLWFSTAHGGDSHFDYNLYFDSTDSEITRRGGTWRYSYAAYQAAGYEPNSVVSQDPIFVDQDAADFRLQGTSPAIDAGVDVGLPYEGAAPDIGAFEYGLGIPVIVAIVVVVVVAVISVMTP